MIGVVHVDEVGHLGLAGTAPGGPEIDQDILALADVVGELDRGGLGVLRVLDDGEVHEGGTFGGFDLGFEGGTHLDHLGDVLEVVGKTVQEGDHLTGVIRHDLRDGHQADDVVGIGLRGFLLILVEGADDFLVIGLGGFLILAELRHLGAVFGHELLHPFVVGGIARLRAFLVGRNGGTGLRVDGDGGTVGKEGHRGVARLEDGDRREVLREVHLETAVLDNHGGVQDIAQCNLHDRRGLFALTELTYDLRGIAGLRSASREQQRSGQVHQVCFHICLS